MPDMEVEVGSKDGDGSVSDDATVLAAYRRYVVEFVESLNLCPWAAEARLREEVEVRVIRGAPFPQEIVEAFIDEVGASDKIIGIAIFADLGDIAWSDWRATVARLQSTESKRHARAPLMAMAPFHPGAPADISTDGRLTAFIRRTPHPTLQLVRQSTLETVRDDPARRTAFFDPHTMDAETFMKSRRSEHFGARIVESNRKSIERFGLEEADALLLDILGRS